VTAERDTGHAVYVEFGLPVLRHGSRIGLAGKPHARTWRSTLAAPSGTAQRHSAPTQRRPASFIMSGKPMSSRSEDAHLTGLYVGLGNTVRWDLLRQRISNAGTDQLFDLV
jgi:hypothetical protein